MERPVKVLVFMLPRLGCLAYATPLVEALSNIQKKVYASAYSTERLPKDSAVFPTYRNTATLLWNSLWVLPRIFYRIYQDKKQGYQVVYFPMFHPWHWPIMIWCRWWGLRVVYTVHDGKPHKGEVTFFHTWLRFKCIQSSDQLIFLSQYVKNQVVGHLPEKAISIVVPHGLTIPKGLIDEPRNLPETPRLLFLGRLSAYKGIEMLIEAVVRIRAGGRPVDLTIAGMPVGKWRPPPLGSDIRFHSGWLEEEEVAVLLHAHDILVLPYQEASQSGVITVGIAAGVPMVCTRVGGLVEQLDSDEAVWVSPNAEGVREGILRLINDPELYADLHQKMRKKRQELAWSKIAREVESVLINRN